MRRALLLAVGVAIAATPALAEQASGAVAAARGAGLVGERSDGYLGVAGASGDTLRRQVASLNLLRRTLYARLAQSRGVSPDEVGMTAACQLLATVRVGERYALSDHVWRTRRAGQAAPVPDYCR